MIQENQRFDTLEAAEEALRKEGFEKPDSFDPCSPDWPWTYGLVDARIREIQPDQNAAGERYYRVHFRA